ncbi:hypothetical protein FBR4_2793 [Lactiplantibacillus plantarum]|jgi:hypothetical protein|nr:hypothetical protein LBP_p6g005 [Lactiplantibacillus plantarum subsp. plantarum P-8]KZD90130.1 hypothetical protein FBR4_2793 [Lactiplantibacillus plantarum]
MRTYTQQLKLIVLILKKVVLDFAALKQIFLIALHRFSF